MLRIFISILPVLIALVTTSSAYSEPQQEGCGSEILAVTRRIIDEHPVPFYRIIDDERPRAKWRQEWDRMEYGAEILYTGDAKAVGHPIHVHGTVWHANQDEAKFFIGDSNPILDHPELVKRLEDNKWEEAKFLQKYVPEAFAKTENMEDVLKDLRLKPAESGDRYEAIAEVCSKLRKRYPMGFFLKPISGFSGAGTHPTDKTDCAASLKLFDTKVKPRIQRMRAKGVSANEIHLKLCDLDGYEGGSLDSILSSPDQVIVQARLKPAYGDTRDGERLLEEYRLHLVDGRVVEGATLNRWTDMRNSTPRRVAEVNRFGQWFLDKLPEDAKRLTYNLDVMRTQDGSYKVIELNLGGESGYMYPEYDLVIPHLVASQMAGRPTYLVKALQEVKSAKSFDEVDRTLAELTRLKVVSKAWTNGDVMSEFLRQAKDRILTLLKRERSPVSTRRALQSIHRWDLEWVLSRPDTQYLADRLRELGWSASKIDGELDLAGDEFALAAPSQRVRVLGKFEYLAQDVETKLVDLATAEIRARGRGTKINRRALVERLVRENVLTRAQLERDPNATRKLARRMDDLRGHKLIYDGTQKVLIKEVLKRLK